MEEQKNFFFMGKYFATLEELILYEAAWQTKILDEETAEMLVKTLGKEIVMNTLLTCDPMTNGEFRSKLNLIFDESIKILRHEEKTS